MQQVGCPLTNNVDMQAWCSKEHVPCGIRETHSHFATALSHLGSNVRRNDQKAFFFCVVPSHPHMLHAFPSGRCLHLDGKPVVFSLRSSDLNDGVSSLSVPGYPGFPSE